MFRVLKLPERRNLGSARVAQPLLAQGTAPGRSLRAEALLQTRKVPGIGSPIPLSQTRRVPKQHEIAGSGRHRCWQTPDLGGASAGNLLDGESWDRRITRPGQCWCRKREIAGFWHFVQANCCTWAVLAPGNFRIWSLAEQKTTRFQAPGAGKDQIRDLDPFHSFLHSFL